MEIKEIRALTGLTQHQFAEKYHIPLSTYRKWEISAERKNHRECPSYVKELLEKAVRGDLSMVRSETVGTTLEANIAMLATFPEEKQREIYTYLVMQCGNDNPFRPVGREEIYAELEESRSCFERGEYKDFGEAIDEIRIKYGL